MSLADNVHMMTNRELNGLAQNRFIDNKTQVKLANHYYRLCREYLAMNPNLCTEARDILWDRRGYVLKTMLMSAGHYANEPEKYHELYETLKNNKNVSPWRVQTAFVYNYWHRQPGPSYTPSSIIEDIAINNPFGFVGYTLDTLARHPNLTRRAACYLTTVDFPRVSKTAFERLATDLA